MVCLTSCVSRTKRPRPHAAFSFRTCSLTVDCLRFRLAPASVKLSVRATATKLFSQLGSSITLDIPIYDNSNSGHASLQWHAYRRPGQNEKNPDFVRSLYRTHDDNDRVRGSFSCPRRGRSEENTYELKSLMRTSYAVFCLKKKKHNKSLQNTKRIK